MCRPLGSQSPEEMMNRSFCCDESACATLTPVMTSEPIAVCLAGATDWAGSELARAIASSSDVVLVAAVSRTHAGRRLGEVLGDARITCPVFFIRCGSAREPV